MRKLRVLFSTLIAVSGMALVGVGFLLLRLPASGPLEAKVAYPPAPLAEPVVAAVVDVNTVAVPAVAAIDLNTRDAMMFSGDEIASIEMSDTAFTELLASLHRDDMVVSDDVAMAMDLVAPPAAPAPAAPASVGSAPASWFHVRHFVWHRIRWGETLSGIALRTGTTVHRLQVLNGIRCANFIIAGRWILVPA